MSPLSRRFRPLAALLLVLVAADLRSDDALTGILDTGAESAQAGQAAQERIDALAAETSALLAEYRTLSRQLDGLALHNARLERQYEDQQRRLAGIAAASEGAVALQREITPLLVRMIDSLEQFVALDLPFRLEERRARIAALREALGRSDTPLDAAFGAVLAAYRSELDYATAIGSWTEAVEIDGESRTADLLHVGRSLLLAQTADQQKSLRWDPATAGWVALDDDYAGALRDAIRSARGELAPRMLRLPFPAAAAEPAP
jgi:hypothetical protein